MASCQPEYNKGTLEYIVKQRKLVKELYAPDITPTKQLQCGVSASTLAFYIVSTQIDKKKRNVHVKKKNT